MANSLSYILRPKTTKSIIGQKNLLGNKGVISKIIEKQFTPNLIFYGPPGVGKTSMAIALSNDLNLEYFIFNASTDKKESLSKIITTYVSQNKIVILIIEEIHRMNRNIQDYLLEYAESKKIIIYSTTTENPYFVINPALRSRSTILKLEKPTIKEIKEGLLLILNNNDIKIDFINNSFELLCELSNGDLRKTINACELLWNLYSDVEVDEQIVTSLFDDAVTSGSYYGDEYHDLKSAFQKSIRGSDVDAALYYWSRLMVIGDYEIIMRRMQIIAYEDIGLANPQLCQRVYTSCEVFRQIGMPEGRIILGLSVIEMALSEKSNTSLMAIDNALNDVKKGKIFDIPTILRDNNYSSASKLGSGIGYKYPHNFNGSYVEQEYLPKELLKKQYYKSKKESLYEKKIVQIYNNFTKKQK